MTPFSSNAPTRINKPTKNMRVDHSTSSKAVSRLMPETNTRKIPTEIATTPGASPVIVWVINNIIAITKNNIPFYPKPFGDNQKKYKKYKKIADFSNDVIFVGRLATYKYLDMDDAIAQVFNKLKNI